MTTLEYLRDPEYLYWVKTALCLQYVRDGLVDFTATKSLELHRNILQQLRHYSNTSVNGLCVNIRFDTRRKCIVCRCGNCNAIITELMKYRRGNLDLNLKNSNPSQLLQDHWQMAKLFMNTGQDITNNDPNNTDLSGLLNFTDHCTVPRNCVTNLHNIQQVRDIRNQTMHTCCMTVTENQFQNRTSHMIGLLQDPRYLYQDQKAQAAVENIKQVKCADFKITRKNEERALKQKCDAISKLFYKLREAFKHHKEGTETELSSFEEELQKVKDMCNRFEQIIIPRTDLDNLKYEVANLTKSVEQELIELKEEIIKLKKEQLEQQQQIKDLGEEQKHQKEHQKRTDEELEHQKGHQKRTDEELEHQKEHQKRTDEELGHQKEHQKRTDEELEHQKEYQKRTDEELGHQKEHQKRTDEEVEHQKEHQKRTDEDIADLKQKFTQPKKTPSDEDIVRLQEYLKKGYREEKVDVLLLPDCELKDVSEIFSCLIIERHEKDNFKKTKNKKILSSFKDMFHSQRWILLLGEAGAGKTTFCKHLTDLWCNDSSSGQFEDAVVVTKFRFLFFVSCRYAKKETESIYEMIFQQLFDKEDMRNVARHVLKTCPNECFIIVDGLDEWIGSPSQSTGRLGDMKGLPGANNVHNTVILISSRPDRLYDLPTKTLSNVDILQIDGLKNVKNFAELICKILGRDNPKDSSERFFSEVESLNMHELLKVPLISILAIGAWDRSGKLNRSLCLNYFSMIESLILRSEGEKGWLESDSRVTKTCMYNLADLKTKWTKSAHLLPECSKGFSSFHTYAECFIKVGELAYELLFNKKRAVFSEDEYRGKITDDEFKVANKIGILTKLQTKHHGIKKEQVSSFCHKSFQEFLAALWVSTNSKGKIRGFFQKRLTQDDVFNYEIFLQFLCGMCPELRTQFLEDLIEAVEDKLASDFIFIWWHRLMLKCQNEADHCNPHLKEQHYLIYPVCDLDLLHEKEDITKLYMLMQKKSDKIKAFYCMNVCLDENDVKQLCTVLSSCSDLRIVVIIRKTRCLLDLQINETVTNFQIKGINLKLLSQPMPKLCLLSLNSVTLTHCEIVGLEPVLVSSSQLRKLELHYLTCSEHLIRSCLSELNLKLCKSVKELSIKKIPFESLLLPSQENTPLSRLELEDLTLTDEGIRQLYQSLTCMCTLENLTLSKLKCIKHTSGSCLSVLDLQKCTRVEEIWLWNISIERLLLPSQEDNSLSRLELEDLTLTDEGITQLYQSLSCMSTLRNLTLSNLKCIVITSGSCLSVLDLQKCTRVNNLWLWNISIERLLLPSQEDNSLSRLRLEDLTLADEGIRQLYQSLTCMCTLENLKLYNLKCIEHTSGSCLSVLDLQKCTRVEEIWLRNISIERLLLPSQEDNSLSILVLEDLTLTDEGIRQLYQSLPCMCTLENLKLSKLKCIEHTSGSCLSVLNLQKCTRVEFLWLKNISIERLLLPIQEDNSLSILVLEDLTLTDEGITQLYQSLSCMSTLRNLTLSNLKCFNYTSGSCLSVLNLHKCTRVKNLLLRNISIERLLLPSQEDNSLFFLELKDLTLTDEGIRQLYQSLSCMSTLGNFKLSSLKCIEHTSESCLSVLDLQKCTSVKNL